MKIIFGYIKNIKKESYIVAFLLFLMSLLSFINLGNRYMFADESICAMLGNNILKYGFPSAWDGKNLVMASVNGNEFNEMFVFIRDNWLPYFFSALGQLISRLFVNNAQISVICMRAIFVIIGIIGALFFYFLTRKLTNDITVSIFAMSLYTLSVPVILYIRSIYYLSPVLTFSIMTVFFYIKYIEDANKKNWIGFTISAILLFHSMYPFFFIVLIVLGTAYILFDKKKGNILGSALSIACITAFTLPWYLYSRKFLSQVETGLFVGIKFFWQLLSGYLWQIHTYFFPFIPLGLIYLFYSLITRLHLKNKHADDEINYYDNIHKIKNIDKNGIEDNVKLRLSERNTSLEYRNRYIIVGLIICNVLIISLFNNLLETRWLIVTIPYLYIVCAYIINYLYKKDSIISFTILFLLIFTNVFNISPYMIIKKCNINPQKLESIVKPPVPFFDANENGYSNKKADLSKYLNEMCFGNSYIFNYVGEIANRYSDANEGMIKFLQKYGEKSDKVHLIGYQYESIAFYTGMTVVNRLNSNINIFPTTYKYYPNAIRYEYLTKYPIEQCDWIIERKIDEPIDLNNDSLIWHDESLFEKFYIDYPEANPWCEIWAHTFFTDHSYPGFYIFRNRKTTEEIHAENIIGYKQLDSK